jgi:hypothetical protein
MISLPYQQCCGLGIPMQLLLLLLLLPATGVNKCIVQQVAAHKAEREWVEQNPGRFGSCYCGSRAAEGVPFLNALAPLWQSLYELESASMQDKFVSSADCVGRVCAASSASPSA